MSRIDAIQCDRCKSISATEHQRVAMKPITVGDRTLDLCLGCRRELDRFLEGDKLEVPP